MERLKKQMKSHIHHRRGNSTASDKENTPDDYGDDDGGRLSVDDLDSEDVSPDRHRGQLRGSGRQQRRSLDDSDLLL